MLDSLLPAHRPLRWSRSAIGELLRVTWSAAAAAQCLAVGPPNPRQWSRSSSPLVRVSSLCVDRLLVQWRWR
ncbi:hypothetical protein Syun_029793 [Stephania yunnanensis]|uniref:Uncharacterized protein n=1 Tax=Stephania yunnanensis TaxID=152371 RepID=A0AAP0EEJ3_9MAGN